jgi:hypothetical protein
MVCGRRLWVRLPMFQCFMIVKIKELIVLVNCVMRNVFGIPTWEFVRPPKMAICGSVARAIGPALLFLMP